MESKFGNYYEDFIVNKTINHALSKQFTKVTTTYFALFNEPSSRSFKFRFCQNT